MEIWEKIRKGDVKSYESAFNQWYAALCLYAFRIVADEDVAKEMVSDVFLKVWQKRETIVLTYGLRPFLYRSVHNACLDYLRSAENSRHKKWIELNEKICNITGEDEGYIFNLLSYESVDNEVQRAIEKLPKQCREIFCLSRFELLTYNEISDRLNISVNTVKTQMGRALDFLRQELKHFLYLTSILLPLIWFALS
jgi:RNA polymerase sigma-70 factor, ECF subfamily